MSATILPTLPSMWATVRLKWLLDSLESGRREISDTDDFEGGALSIGGEHVGWQGQWLLDNPRYISREFFAAMSSGRIRKDDILLVKDGATIGKVAIATTLPADETAVNEHVFLLRVSPDNFPKYYFYFVQSSPAQDQIQLEVRGSAQPGLNSEFRNVLVAPRPPREIQRAIADYLDRETARLDALVAAKERVIGLLAEKRRALITRAVTRGLDPRAPLRDSGIPWLGEIPAHWEIWKLGHIALVGNGSTPNRDNQEYWFDGSIPWLNSSVVNQDEVTASEQFVTDAAVRECHLPLVRSGSVLVGITGQGKTRGQAVVLSFDATINQHIAFVTPCADWLDAWYLRWALHAAYEFLRSISDDAGGTKGALTCEAVGSLRVPVPPIVQQRAIVDQVAAETTKLNEMRIATERTIALLKERRAAVIAAAVTGQLDIREVDA